MGLIQEFKEFAVKGNAVDMAVGIILGASFGKIVSSLVSDVIMPPLGLIIGGVNFSHLGITLREATNGQQAVTLGYGSFIQTIFDFAIVAIAMFSLIKVMNQLRTKQEPAPEKKVPEQELLLAEIRDILKGKSA